MAVFVAILPIKLSQHCPSFKIPNCNGIVIGSGYKQPGIEVKVHAVGSCRKFTIRGSMPAIEGNSLSGLMPLQVIIWA